MQSKLKELKNMGQDPISDMKKTSDGSTKTEYTCIIMVVIRFGLRAFFFGICFYIPYVLVCYNSTPSGRKEHGRMKARRDPALGNERAETNMGMYNGYPNGAQ
jgi:hypothetical protein